MILSNRLVLSVMGPHAGEDESSIFNRKISDIQKVGQTLWVCQSPAARPDRILPFFEKTAVANIVFLAPSSPNGARPTTSAQQMSQSSMDGVVWKSIDARLGPVTGFANRFAYSFVLSSIDLLKDPIFIDLWQYVVDNDKPARFKLGASTLLAKHGDSSTLSTRMKSRMRRILAIGVLDWPYSVWVR